MRTPTALWAVTSVVLGMTTVYFAHQLSLEREHARIPVLRLATAPESRVAQDAANSSEPNTSFARLASNTSAKDTDARSTTRPPAASTTPAKAPCSELSVEQRERMNRARESERKRLATPRAERRPSKNTRPRCAGRIQGSAPHWA
jgi:hypothetical protein